MSVNVKRYEPITRTDIGATNVVAIVAPTGVKIVWVSSATALWLCYGFPDDALLPTVARFPIAAGVTWPVQIEADGRLPSVASQAGTATVSFLGEG